MTPERIAELATQANVSIRGHYDETGSTPAELQRLYELVRNEVLEEAATKCDNWGNPYNVVYFGSSCKSAAKGLRSMKK